MHITGQMHLCVQTAFDAPLVFIRGHMEHITAALTVRRFDQNEECRLCSMLRLSHGMLISMLVLCSVQLAGRCVASSTWGR